MIRRRDLLFASLLPAVGLRAQTVGDRLPRFHAKTLDGKQVDNAAIHGKVLLVQYWATWCGFCRKDQESVDKIAREFAPKGLMVLAVNSGEDRIKVREYLAERPRAVSIVLENDTNLAEIYDASGFPKYVVIGRDGRVAAEQQGAGGMIALRDLVSRAGLKSS